MTRPKPTWIPDNVVTLDDLEAFADQMNLDLVVVIWAWGVVADVYRLAKASGHTTTELTERLARWRKEHD